MQVCYTVIDSIFLTDSTRAIIKVAKCQEKIKKLPDEIKVDFKSPTNNPVSAPTYNLLIEDNIVQNIILISALFSLNICFDITVQEYPQAYI